MLVVLRLKRMRSCRALFRAIGPGSAIPARYLTLPDPESPASVATVAVGHPGHSLDMTLFPTRGRIAKLRRKDVVARHCEETDIDLPFFATADTIDRGLQLS